MSEEEAVRLMQPPPYIITVASTFIIGAVAGWVGLASKKVAAIGNLRAELGYTTDRLEHLETAVKALRGEVKEFEKGIHEATGEILESRRAARR